MRLALGLVAAIAVLGCAVVALAPASLVDRVVVAHTDGRVRLADAGGFWWRGHGIVTSNDEQGELPVAWRVRLMPLLHRRFVVDFTAADPGMPSGSVSVAGDDIEAHDLHVIMPAALLPALVPSLGVAAPSGEIDARTASFAWRAGIADGRIDVAWRDARLAIAGFPVALGQIEAMASGMHDVLRGTFENRGGELGVRGAWQVQAKAAEATTTLTASSATPSALRAVLPMLGQAQGDGSVRLEWRARR